jgi:uncharacterized protein (TIGR02444 family)
MSNPLWDFSLAKYEIEAVASLCLALQDDYDMDVNLLLYATWLASRGSKLTAEHLQQLDSLLSPWREEVIKPLRTLRQEMKGIEQAQASREDVKVLELSAEQQEQEMIFKFFSAAAVLPQSTSSVLENLTLVASLSGSEAPAWSVEIGRLAAEIGANTGVASGQGR